MSTQEILAAVASKKLSPTEAAKLLTSAPSRAPRFQVKRNSKGGVFIQHPAVQGYSAEKQKKYTAAINLPVGVAESLFADDAVLAEITAAVRALPVA